MARNNKATESPKKVVEKQLRKRKQDVEAAEESSSDEELQVEGILDDAASEDDESESEDGDEEDEESGEDSDEEFNELLGEEEDIAMLILKNFQTNQEMRLPLSLINYLGLKSDPILMSLKTKRMRYIQSFRMDVQEL